jgi:hypothetical protein
LECRKWPSVVHSTNSNSATTTGFSHRHSSTGIVFDGAVPENVAQCLLNEKEMRTLLGLFFVGSIVLFAQPNGRELVRRSISAMDRSWQARQNYLYTVRDEEHHLDPFGQVKSTDVDISKAILVNRDTVEQSVSHNDGPPLAAKQRKDEETLQKRRKETPSERASRLREEKETREMIKDIPEAFNFRLLGERVVEGRPVYVLDATPKPDFQGRSKQSKILSKVRVKLWLDKQDLGWVKVDIDVISPFSLALLARVQPGSHMTFEQTSVDDGVWLPSRIQINANAKILFVKNYTMNRVITYSEYRLAEPTQVAVRHGSSESR